MHSWREHGSSLNNACGVGGHDGGQAIKHVNVRGRGGFVRAGRNRLDTHRWVISGNEHDRGSVNQRNRAKAVRDVNLGCPVRRRQLIRMCCTMVRCPCHNLYLVRNILSFQLFPTLVLLHGHLCSSCLLCLLFLQCSPQVRHCASYALRKWSRSAFCPVLFQKAQLLVDFLDCVRIVV
jgi:hypothetical protein